MTKDIEQLAGAFWQMQAESDDSSCVVDGFVEMIKERGLMNQVGSIVNAIEKKAVGIEQRQKAVIRTAHEMPDSLKNEVAGDLEGFATHFETNDALIGGIEVQTFDRRISGTIQSMLLQLRQSIK